MPCIANAAPKAKKPKCGDHRQPEYTEEAKNLKVFGTVVLIVDVGQDGCVLDARVEKGLGHGLDQKAIEAVKTWKFDPARKDGVPVRVLIRLEVVFKLPEDATR
jgi:protein TonB